MLLEMGSAAQVIGFYADWVHWRPLAMAYSQRDRQDRRATESKSGSVDLRSDFLVSLKAAEQHTKGRITMDEMTAKLRERPYKFARRTTIDGRNNRLQAISKL